MVTPGQMRTAMVVALGVAAVAGLALAALAGWELLLVGAAALVAAVGYSGGPRPYASVGLGEVFVFVFFGVVATVGSAYVQDERITALALVASLPMGLLATALLVVNNLRDIPTDREVGKVTLAVRLGESATRRLYVALVVGALLVPVGMLFAYGEGWFGLPVVSMVVAWQGVTALLDGVADGLATGRVAHDHEPPVLEIEGGGRVHRQLDQAVLLCRGQLVFRVELLDGASGFDRLADSHALLS